MAAEIPLLWEEGVRSFALLEMVGLGKCSPETEGVKGNFSMKAEGVKGRLAPEEAGVMAPEEEKGEGERK